MRARGAEIAKAEGVISLGAQEGGKEGVPVVTQRGAEKIMMRLGTRSIERREPQIWDVMEGRSLFK